MLWVLPYACLYKLSSAVASGQNHREEQGPGVEPENGRQRRTQYLSKRDQVVLESAVEGKQITDYFSNTSFTQRNNLNFFLKRETITRKRKFLSAMITSTPSP